MDMLTALALSIGVLIAIWTYVAVAVVPDLSVWAAIVAWGCFFAAGGKALGFQKTVFANLSGLIYVWIITQILPHVGGSTIALAILVGVIAFVMVVQSKIPALSFIPGAFIGAAVTVGSGAASDTKHLLYVAVSLVIGAALGLISEAVAGSMAKKA